MRRKQAARSQKRAHTGRRRNCRVYQFCVHVVTNERQVLAYAVKFKAPHKLTVPGMVSGLHEMGLAHNVINQEGNTFEFHATHFVAAVVTGIFSDMIDCEVSYGYICTGEAFAFLQLVWTRTYPINIWSIGMCLSSSVRSTLKQHREIHSPSLLGRNIIIGSRAPYEYVLHMEGMGDGSNYREYLLMQCS